MIEVSFGVDNFNYGHVFNSDSNDNEILYGGYTIKHDLPEFNLKGYPVAKWDYQLKTTVVGTDFENIITKENIYMSEVVSEINADRVIAESKAMTFIDGITNDNVSRTDSNGNNNGNNNGTPVEGCMDDTATNYDETATVDDGTCEYEGDENNDNLIYLGLGAGALLILMGLR